MNVSFDEYKPGSLVSLRGRAWVVMPSDDDELFLVKPLGGTENEITGIYKPLANDFDKPVSYNFKKPGPEDLGDFRSARLLYNAARLSFRQVAGPFRCLGKVSFRPRSYQMVPLIMALKQEKVRLLIADDVGVGKTVEALLIAKEFYERKEISRLAIVCLPHLCDQWQEELKGKFGIEAVIIRSGSVTALEKQIRINENIFRAFPFQIISIDYIKSGEKRQKFIDHAPEMIIVDEAHTCARPSGANDGQQLRFKLLRELMDQKAPHLVMLTATPHSGKTGEFQSLLGLLDREFENVDISDASATNILRKQLADRFIQRRRADVLKWMKDDAQFPERLSVDIPVHISGEYAEVFNEVLDYSLSNILVTKGDKRKERYTYWETLALLRGIMSSPAAGAAMLRKKAEKHRISGEEDVFEELPYEAELADARPLADDNLPLIESPEEIEVSQQQLLTGFAERLEAMKNIENDTKAREAVATLKGWLKEQRNPVVFCRFIQTANYLGALCKEYFTGKAYKSLQIEVITSEADDELRREKITSMSKKEDTQRLLIATDCLSEGINLQEGFDAVLHYDLPWNPNRLEQREGRVDRFGQQKPEVYAGRLYGANNPIDGLVLEVLLKKSDEIRSQLGVSVPVPEDNKSLMNALYAALKFKDNFRIREDVSQGNLFNDEAMAEITVLRNAMETNAEREKLTRTIFAHHAIKADKVEDDLKEVDEAIGDVPAVESFVTEAIRCLGAEIVPHKKGYKFFTTNIPERLRDWLPPGNELIVSFHSPTPFGYHYIGRNHLFVEHLCQHILNTAISNTGNHAARAAVMRTADVSERTVLFQFRVRNVIAEQPVHREIVAEEMWLWGYKGELSRNSTIEHAQAKQLLMNARATDNVDVAEQNYWLSEELTWITDESEFRKLTDPFALERAGLLVKAHLRFRELVGGKKFKVVEPILPMDVLGVYILLPEVSQHD
jgi:superfamily II DNA or RNA helicase